MCLVLMGMTPDGDLRNITDASPETQLVATLP
jgi:hypothetical protein